MFITSTINKLAVTTYTQFVFSCDMKTFVDIICSVVFKIKFYDTHTVNRINLTKGMLLLIVECIDFQHNNVIFYKALTQNKHIVWVSPQQVNIC